MLFDFSTSVMSCLKKETFIKPKTASVPIFFFLSSNLSNNKISEIEDGAFEGASSVAELHLTANHLESVRGSMFRGMEGLRML